MTLNEAFAELGIDHDASADDARRAYLKLLKQRKPETDPQGFMRLREAYELARGGLASRDAFLQAFGAAPGLERDPPTGTAPSTPEGVSVPPAPEMDEPPADDVEAQPPVVEAPGMVAEEPPVPADEPVVAAPQLPIRPPAAADAPNEASVDLLLDGGLSVPAAAELTLIFEAATRLGHGPPPPVGKALRLLVRLHVEDAVAAAAALHDGLAAWLRASGEEARVIRGDVAARWTVLRELRALPDSFPSVVRAAIGRALLAGDLGSARGELSGLRDTRLRAARAAATALRSKAPVLAAAVADVLDPREAPPRAAAARRSGNGGWAVGATLVVGLLRVLMMLAGGSSSKPAYHPPTYANPQYTLSGLFDGGAHGRRDGGLAAPSATNRLDDLRDRVRDGAASMQEHARDMLALDAGRRRVDYAKVRSDVNKLGLALEHDDCKTASAALKKVEAHMLIDAGGADDEIGQLYVETLGRSLRTFCAEAFAARAPLAPASAGPVVLDAGRRGGTDHP